MVEGRAKRITEKLKRQAKAVTEVGKKLVDKLDVIPDIALKAGVAYSGYVAMQHWTGAIVGLLGLRLASSNNLAGGAAGVAILTGIGITDLQRAIAQQGSGYKPNSEAPNPYLGGGGAI